MASRNPWAEFFARHTERNPNGVIAGLWNDWQRTKVDSGQAVDPAEDLNEPQRRTNRDTPRRLARMLAERFRRP